MGEARKAAALRRVSESSQARDDVTRAYANALHDAHDAGATWAEIAKAAGDKSGASVFRFARRHSRQ